MKIKNTELKVVRTDDDQFVYSVFKNDNQLIGFIENTNIQGITYVWRILWEQNGELFDDHNECLQRMMSYNLIDKWYLDSNEGSSFDIRKIYANGLHVAYLSVRKTINNIYEAGYTSGIVPPAVFPSPTYASYLDAIRSGLNSEIPPFIITKENPLTFSQDGI